MFPRACLVIVLGLLGLSAARAADKLELTVKETAGIRRFGYPVAVTLTLPRDVTSKDRFRLLANGKPVAAQFRPLSALGKKRDVALDFNVSFAPSDSIKYTVEYGPDVAAGREPKAGTKVEEGKEAFTIRSGGMVYVVPRDLKGLLKEVRDGKKEFTRPNSAGLSLLAGKKAHPVGGRGFKARVVRQGPLAVALHFEGDTGVGDGKKVASVIDLTFPSSKSWVEVRWRPRVTEETDALAVDLNLLATGTPTLVDFGAGSLVYTTLNKGQSALLRARPKRKRLGNDPWGVFTGRDDHLRPFVLPVPDSRPAEGWAHLMDRRRCTAIAVSDFGRTSHDEIRLDADGRLRLWRRRDRGTSGLSEFRFWLHFVDMPVQVGALTSPQSMLAPLHVEVKEAR
jgi:hypothetical protein